MCASSSTTLTNDRKQRHQDSDEARTRADRLSDAPARAGAASRRAAATTTGAELRGAASALGYRRRVPGAAAGDGGTHARLRCRLVLLVPRRAQRVEAPGRGGGGGRVQRWDGANAGEDLRAHGEDRVPVRYLRR